MVRKETPEKPDSEDFHYNSEVNLRTILQNAIRTQAIYSGRKITIVESSKRTN